MTTTSVVAVPDVKKMSAASISRMRELLRDSRPAGKVEETKALRLLVVMTRETDMGEIRYVKE